MYPALSALGVGNCPLPQAPVSARDSPLTRLGMLGSLSWLSGPSRFCSTRCARKVHPLRNCRQKTARKLVQPKPTTACRNISVSKSQYPRSLVPGAFSPLRKPRIGFACISVHLWYTGPSCPLSLGLFKCHGTAGRRWACPRGHSLAQAEAACEHPAATVDVAKMRIFPGRESVCSGVSL